MNFVCFGCPKAERLLDQLVWLETCARQPTNDAHWHCSRYDMIGLKHKLERDIIVVYDMIGLEHKLEHDIIELYVTLCMGHYIEDT